MNNPQVLAMKISIKTQQTELNNTAFLQNTIMYNNLISHVLILDKIRVKKINK